MLLNQCNSYQRRYKIFSKSVKPLVNENGNPSIPPLLLANHNQIQKLQEQLDTEGTTIYLSESMAAVHHYLRQETGNEYPEIPPHAADYSIKLLEMDLNLESKIFWPSNVEAKCDAPSESIRTHSSTLNSPLFKKPLELQQVSSWLLSLWEQDEEIVEEILFEHNPSVLERKRANTPRTPKKRSLNDTRSPSIAARSPSLTPRPVGARIASTQPMSSRTQLPVSQPRSASQPNQEGRKKKRKGGF